MAEVEIEDSIYAPNNGQKDYPICTAFQSDPEDRTPPPPPPGIPPVIPPVDPGRGRLARPRRGRVSSVTPKILQNKSRPLRTPPPFFVAEVVAKPVLRSPVP